MVNGKFSWSLPLSLSLEVPFLHSSSNPFIFYQIILSNYIFQTIYFWRKECRWIRTNQPNKSGQNGETEKIYVLLFWGILKWRMKWISDSSEEHLNPMLKTLLHFFFFFFHYLIWLTYEFLLSPLTVGSFCLSLLISSFFYFFFLPWILSNLSIHQAYH